MFRTIARCTPLVLVASLVANVGYAQLDGLYEFDGGGDGTSWDEATNWEQVFDPDGAPIAGDPPTPPSPTTSADIPLAGVVIDNTMPGQTALDVRIGTAAGAGSLAISGGDLTLRDLFVGSDTSGGSLSISGGTLVSGDDIRVGAGVAASVVQSGGDVSTNDDYVVGADSSLTLSGGTIVVGDRLVLEDNATLDVSGGEIAADDDFFFFGDSAVTVSSGLIQTVDKLRFDDDAARNGKLTIDGGTVRSNEFGLADIGFRGLVEINGDGVLEVQAPTSPDSPFTQLSRSQAQALIDAGVHLVTSEPSKRLGVKPVIVADFFGDADVLFMQISVVPEPTGLVLALCAMVGSCLLRRRVR